MKIHVSAELDVDITAPTTLEFQIAVAPTRKLSSLSRCRSFWTGGTSRRWRSPVCTATEFTNSTCRSAICRSTPPRRSSDRPTVRRRPSTTCRCTCGPAAPPRPTSSRASRQHNSEDQRRPPAGYCDRCRRCVNRRVPAELRRGYRQWRVVVHAVHRDPGSGHPAR
jgi:hypothetical protein